MDSKTIEEMHRDRQKLTELIDKEINEFNDKFGFRVVAINLFPVLSNGRLVNTEVSLKVEV